jgi:hypothetical protein
MNHFRLSSLVNLVCTRFSVGLLLSLCLFQMSALAEKVLVGQKSGDGKFTFISADEILINGSRKIKLASKSNGILDASALKSLPKVEISRVGVIKGDEKGALFAIAGGEQKRVLPENFTAKEVSDPVSLQVPIEIKVVRGRKGKDSTVVPTQTFCIYIPGEAEPERAGEAFVLHVENFSSLDQQLSAIEGFVASFPGSPAVNDLRVSLERQLQAAIRAYDAGGTYQALSDARKMADLIVKEFPNDRALAEATKQIDQQREQTMGAYRHLQDLAGMEDWADFLAAYQNFELHADSFPEIQALHRRALEGKVHMDCRNGRALLLRKSENEAVRKFAEALEKDPANAEIQKQWERARMRAAKSEAAYPH